MLRCLGDLNGELDPAKVGRGAVNHFTDLFNASRCSLFHQVGGRWRLEQVSNQETIDQRSELVGQLCALAARLPTVSETCPGRSRSTRSRPGGGVDRPCSNRSAPGKWRTRFSRGTRTRVRRTSILLERHAPNAPFTPVARCANSTGRANRSAAPCSPPRRTAKCPFGACSEPVTHARGMWRRRQRVRLFTWLSRAGGFAACCGC